MIRRITVILGAGASKAYDRLRYPLLPNLLPEILSSAAALPGTGGKQRLYLAYALVSAYSLGGPNLDKNEVREEIIQEQFLRLRALPEIQLQIVKAFQELEAMGGDTATRAYWALTHAIAFYMLQMAREDIDRPWLGPVDRGHKKLITLIDDLLSVGGTVGVVDFNYDCVLERVKFGLNTPRFGWNCGRERKVIADEMDDTPLSLLVDADRFQRPLDERNDPGRVELIKPHGDMCTFLRGPEDVFYRGGRHSQTTTAVFPERLADISPDDRFVRSSILPPTNSRFRHMSKFYACEAQRFEKALEESETVVVIGWSASGADTFYDDLIRPLWQRNARGPAVFVIDYQSEDTRQHDSNALLDRLQYLFDGKATFKEVEMSGFSEATVKKLRRFLLAEE